MAASEPWCRHLTQKDRINCVCIVGGTHGNETNGVYLGRNFAKIQGPPGAAHGQDFRLMVIESNPEAVKANKRYIDEDLNRCFTCANLADETRTKLYEHRRAREINAMLGPKTSPTPVCDYVLDLHNTTAATGVALFLHPRDKFSQELAAYLISTDPSVHVALWADRDVVLLPSVGRSGMTFEVGPVSIGCLDAKLYRQSETLVQKALGYMSAHNAARKRTADGGPTAERRPATLQCVQLIQTVPFPRNSDKELTGMIHPALDGRDFAPLRAADPVFAMFDGTEQKLGDVVKLEQEVVYPFLVNETSYYEKDVAFVLGKQVEFQVDVLVI
eukprot:TRINITY_DN31726_c0_g1_i1.p1 TRINITY_DN31726_c0_g1~~TRINITY_DN31726_c0_g1_i1.p1  ORF type:complete len:348 (+),score=75.48 TRINITY_DN31726_c0_g1_i1:55-1044(+)